ncbi:hypothetical protein [Elizabethkingia anophelis]|uniref:hypothetical protein n=1 Tax=Elizabethkingia anophelis TaxID=1117645 RepID=UPI00038A4386|nr:hypothetical protein [Elizabethkingia anophelis]EQB90958.1 hypothetical protein C874_14705 [Elizabethkingia anophelis 502]
MNLVSVRIITANIDSLINFYEQITGIQAVQYTPDFAEIKTSTQHWPLEVPEHYCFWRGGGSQGC